ncbi:MAG: hypothetical protein IKP73_20710 [Bacteroidales bacterium]|nr:hypothetical protein [Bacteroidales bacterium]
MKIDVTSMFFNSRIEGQTATPAWGTSIGQNRSRECRIDDFKPEIVDVLMGMTYKSITDYQNLNISRGSSGREVLIGAVFDNIFINNQHIDDAQFVLLLVREHSKSHEGRLLVTYAPYITYNNIANQDCIDKMREVLNCTENGCWFVYDITIKNQSDLFFNAVVVNATTPVIYSNSSRSRNRTEEWRALIPNRNVVTNINISENYRTFLAALRTKPFLLLAGISGTGKSRIVRKLAQASVTEDLQTKYDPLSVANGFNRWTLHKPANFELIQVKPNWHNSLEVVGYKSNIGGAHYEFTPFVEFVAKAWKHQDVPFFLCLDEMNLAPVEQYFAEFLSAIESRSIENGEYETDPIIKPFDEFGEDVCKQMLDHLVGIVAASNVTPDSNEAKMVKRFRTKGLTLPKNLFVLGTVNMDETTFSFSRKVLDRAMSIVMDDVDYESFFSGSTENDIAEMSEDLKQLLINRETEGPKAENNDADTVKEYLTNINAVLENTPFKLGYRAANEALLYVSAVNYLSDEPNTKAALDEFTLMKILSRIEGDKRSIDDLLDKLKGVINSTDFPKSNKVLGSMSETLNKKQFVSYWTK